MAKQQQARTKSLKQLESQKIVLMQRLKQVTTVGQEKALKNKIIQLNNQIEGQKYFEYLAM